ncbi:MAG: hypothetical protein AMJ72_09600 [Acidithiobacillales bacterium SM1_46]|jgi:hypothetical protein|nr:MAG: hypothetical protein AMJ72_09600 [Acidithiobacillales bacterium SM1_46]
MRNFTCTCGNTLYFENTRCFTCGRVLGFLPETLTLSALEPAGEVDWRALAARGDSYRQCKNYREENVCNWMVPSDDPHAFCRACRLNQVIPNLSDPRNRVLWARVETAKRRLLYTLMRLGLPLVSRTTDPQRGLAFEFLADPATGLEFADHSGAQQVLTGHRAGLITINIAEADPSAREGMRERMGEQYRTLLGHFRHESAHYYWDLLIRGTQWEKMFRDQFGDERADYAEALRRYYEELRTDWQSDFISAYASAHPWEDFAETWAHYLHMVDTLETAHAHGFAVEGRTLRPPVSVDAPRSQRDAALDMALATFDELLGDWIKLTVAMNALNRSMGLDDAYPFTLSPLARAKLRFVHHLIAAHAT